MNIRILFLLVIPTFFTACSEDLSELDNPCESKYYDGECSITINGESHDFMIRLSIDPSPSFDYKLVFHSCADTTLHMELEFRNVIGEVGYQHVYPYSPLNEVNGFLGIGFYTFNPNDTKQRNGYILDLNDGLSDFLRFTSIPGGSPGDFIGEFQLSFYQNSSQYDDPELEDGFKINLTDFTCRIVD